jgi:hypothetical protein
MQDRPTVAELLDAVREFLEKDALEGLEGTAKFHARVAANVMAIAGRELELGPAQVEAEWARLADLLGPVPMPPSAAALRQAVRQSTEALCERIRQGDADEGPFRAAVLAHVRATVREKLAIANPKLLAAEAPIGE